MPYSPLQVYATVPAQTVDNNNWAGRDAWARIFADILQYGGWGRRIAPPVATITSSGGPAVSALVFLDCSAANDGNWAIFRNDSTPKTKVYIVDGYDALGDMDCILAGASDGTYTSIGYIVSATDVNSMHQATIEALRLLDPNISVVETVSPTQTIVKRQSGSNYKDAITFGTNTLASSPTRLWTNAGHILSCQASKIQTNAGVFGADNRLELYVTGNRGGIADVNMGAQGLMIRCSKLFGEFPSLQTVVGATALYDNVGFGGAGTPDGDANGRFAVGDHNPKYGVPYTLFANPHQAIGNSEAVLASDKSYLLASALPLFDVRKASSGSVKLVEGTMFSADSGTGAVGLFNSGYLSGGERKALNAGVGFNKVRYHFGGGAGLQPGSSQLAYMSSGRNTGNVNKGIPWIGDYAHSMDAWLGLAMTTNRGPGDIPLWVGPLWDAMILYEKTSTGPANGSAVSTGRFFQDGAWWRRYTRGAGGAANRGITICLRTTTEPVFA